MNSPKADMDAVLAVILEHAQKEDVTASTGHTTIDIRYNSVPSIEALLCLLGCDRFKSRYNSDVYYGEDIPHGTTVARVATRHDSRIMYLYVRPTKTLLEGRLPHDQRLTGE